MTFRKPRLQAQLTGRAKEVSPARARQVTLLAAARRQAGLERKVTRLRRELRKAVADLKAAKKELRALTAPTDMELD